MTAHATTLHPDTIAAFLGRQRWFAGKGLPWRLAGTQTLGWLQQPSPERPGVQVLAATVAYAGGDREVYQLPLVHYGHPVEQLGHALVGEDPGDDGVLEPSWVYDALHVKEVTGLWLAGIAGQELTEGGDPRSVRFVPAPGAPDVPLDAPSLVISAEQSNTSLVYGDFAILKVFRRLTAGVNPDVEIQSALARVGCPHVPTPYGWVDGSWAEVDEVPGGGAEAGDEAGDEAGSGNETGAEAGGGESGRAQGSLAVLQEFLRGGTDGWQLARTSVRDLLAERDLHADEVGGDFAAEATRLGETTAGVHADLARALPTGELDDAGLVQLVAGMRARLGRAISDVPALAPYADALRAAYDALAELDLRAAPVPVQRIHGDYHLGQVMRTSDGWKVLDFEGEPAQPLAQRRALSCPLRDVAGMLRSFEYAARHTLPDGAWDAQREYRAAEWAERNRGAFCAGYAAAGGLDPAAHAALLQAYETDKAVYETVYEARHRPGWLRIPLAAIERLSQPSGRRHP